MYQLHHFSQSVFLAQVTTNKTNKNYYLLLLIVKYEDQLHLFIFLCFAFGLFKFV